MISADGVRHKPERLEAMKSFAKPTDAGQLLSFTAALNWMRPHLMEYSPRTQPLYTLLEVALKGKKKRNKATASKIPLAGLWTKEHDDAWEAIVDMLSASVTLAHP